MRIDVSDGEDPFTQYYCPGEFEICCQDPDFVEENIDSAHEANIHLAYEANDVMDKDNGRKEGKEIKVGKIIHMES